MICARVNRFNYSLQRNIIEMYIPIGLLMGIHFKGNASKPGFRRGGNAGGTIKDYEYSLIV
jgi:hypothetical protein